MWNISWRRICTWFYHSITLSLLIPLDFFIFILFTRLRFESLSRVREIRKSCLYLYAVLSFFHNCKAFLAMSSIIFSPKATNKVDQQQHVNKADKTLVVDITMAIFIMYVWWSMKLVDKSQLLTRNNHVDTIWNVYSRDCYLSGGWSWSGRFEPQMQSNYYRSNSRHSFTKSIPRTSWK